MSSTATSPDVDVTPGERLGERAGWWWYEPFQPQAPPETN